MSQLCNGKSECKGKCSPPSLADSVITREFFSHILSGATPIAVVSFCDVTIRNFADRTEVLSRRVYISSSRGSISWKRRSSSCSSSSCPSVLPAIYPQKRISWTPPAAGWRTRPPAHQICPQEHQTIPPTPASPHPMLGAASPLSKKREVKLFQCLLL